MMGSEDAPSQAASAHAWHTRALLLGGCLLGLLFRIPGLQEPMWRDEFQTVWLARLPLSKLAAEMAWHDTHPPLYHLILKAWIAVFGHGDVAVRSLSVCLGMVGLATIGLLALRWWGRRAAAAALLLSATAPGLIHVSQEVRNQMLLPVMLLAALWALDRWLAGGRFRWALCYAVAAAGALYTNYFAIPALLVLVPVVTGALWHKLGRRVWQWGAVNALAVVLVLPWSGVFAVQFEASARYASYHGMGGHGGTGVRSAAAYIAGEDPIRSARILLHSVVSGQAADLLSALAGVGLCLAVLVGRPCRRRGLAWGWVVAAGAFGVAALMGWLHETRGTYCNPRYFAMFAPFCLLTAGYALSPLRSRGYWLVLVILMLAQTVVAARTVRRAPVPWPQVVAHLNGPAGEQAPVVCVSPWAALALRLYGLQAPALDVPFELPGIDPDRQRRCMVANFADSDFGSLDRQLAPYARFWLMTSVSEPDVSLAGSLAVQRYLASRGWVQLRQETFGDADLRLLHRPSSGPGTGPATQEGVGSAAN